MTKKAKQPSHARAPNPVKSTTEEPRRGRAPVILVPLDGSSQAKEALPAARLASRITEASIHVIHAVEHPLPPNQLLQRIGLRRDETIGMIVDQVVGTAATAIVRLAREEHAMLIVMTTRGKTAYLGRIVRPVVEAVIATAPCPVLLVRPEIGEKVAAMTGLRRVLLPLDGAPASAAVIGPALDLADRSGADTDILYVATQASRPSEPGTLTVPYYIDEPQHEWPAWAQEFVTRFGSCLGRCALPSPTQLFLRQGDPATEILRLAVERASDLIVLEWRGCLDPAHAKIVKGVLVDAPCLVLLIQTTQ